MKYFKILTILLFSSVMSFYACNDTTTTNNSPKKEDPKPIDFSNQPTTNSQTSNQTTTEATQNAQGVYHYTCSQGCAGGAGSAVNCSTCGNLLAHNQAYHANANSTSNDSPFITPPTDPSQNSAGVWHYSCGNGCAGGSGSAGACGTCGTTLTHNTAYHQ